MLDNRSGGESAEGSGNLRSADFSVIDFETANSSRASICQVAIVQVRNGMIEDEWSSLVNPEGEFEWFCVRVHGIKAPDVVSSPSFPEIYPRIRDLLAGAITVSHSDFDRQALEQSADRYGLPRLDLTWLDSTAVARSAWPGLSARGGYGLDSLAAFLGIPFQHHDAAEDARAAAQVMLAACQARGCSAAEWLRESNPSSVLNRRNGGPAESIKPAVVAGHGCADILNSAGEVVVAFTGRLSTSRNAAKARAIGAGCTVLDNVTKKTTALVVGMQVPNGLGGHEKSSKQRKAEALAARGQRIAILSERDFWGLLEQPQT